MSADLSIGVIALVPDGWTDIVMPRHQVLWRLARHFQVAWIEPAKGWRDFWMASGRQFMEPDRWSSPTPGLHVMSPGCLHPKFVRPYWLDTLTLKLRLAAARRRLVAQGAERIVLYLWRDEFARAVDVIDHDISCYHIDDEYNFNERDVPNSVRETAG